MTPIRISPLAVAVALALPLHATGAQNLNINGITIDTASGKSLGSLSSQGGMEEFTKLQKELVMTIIKQLGIDFQSLPPQVRGQIEKPQTTNPQALASFSKGLDLADKGQFQAAAAAFKEAVKNDPGFALASGMARLMPHVNLGKEPGAGGNAMKAMRQAAKSEGQQHAHARLEKMNQASKHVNDLGVSDGKGKKEGEAKLDPINLVSNGDTDNLQGPPPLGSPDLLLPRDDKNLTDTMQRDAILGGVFLSWSGFAAGYHEYYDGESWISTVVASGSPSSVSVSFRNNGSSDALVDASIHIHGDMLAETSTPAVDFVINSQCSVHNESCSGLIDRVNTYSSSNYNYSYSEYYSPQYFYTNQWSYIDGVWTYSDVGSGAYYSLFTPQFTYSDWGYWYHSIDYGNSYEDSAGFWVAGELTPAAKIPDSGTANYTGGMIGYTQNYDLLLGAMNWAVNFNTRTVTGTFDNITKNGQSWLNSVNVSGGWNSGQNLVTANLSGSNVTSGTASGAFFGPNAEELGGTWRINHSNGDTGSGIFLGKPGGQPFESYSTGQGLRSTKAK
ncbi:MAG TPA: transferrin-binding protein-like solute binding protein [Thiobacillaceae bacterium]|nr:transferrin-binding protein-like solute binding protein [Thiobacillaceae bacterium]HNI07972.1 transferrin-binding protein-like solute binding protein [Thiobacillaceae bacterium]